jgi:AcrR family transcriptional regulator
MKKDAKKKRGELAPNAAHPGRPRGFDPEKALEAAVQVFWRKGFEGTALSDLTAAMKINRPSIYATFGNKEALFRKALDRYAERMTNYTAEALKEPTARVVAERLLVGTADWLSSPGNPRGCLMVQGALACGEEADPIRQELISRRATGEAALRGRFERAKVEGDLPSEADPGDLARFIMAVIHGMSVLAAGGAGRADLQGVINLSLRGWPR